MEYQKVDWKLINFPLCLAPMVGLSHIVLRQIIKDYLPAEFLTLWPTEMLNSRRLPSEDFAKTPETLKIENECFLVPQILGNELVPIQESVKKLVQWGAHGIDINMGCPVQKALKHNYGVALMGDKNYARDVVRMTVESSLVPVSVKLRAVESQNSEEDLLQFVSVLMDAGAAWICLHPRTASQKRRGDSDWQQIQFLKRKLPIPIIGNGDIQTSQDVWNMKEQTQCDLVMSGRGLAARPWMVWQIAEDMGIKNKELGQAPRSRIEEGAEYGRAFKKFIKLSHFYFGENLALRKAAFYVRMTSPWLVFGQSLVGIVAKSKTIGQLEISVNEFFNYPQEMVSKTELRQ